MEKPVVHLFHLGIEKKSRDTFYQVGVHNFTKSYEDESGTLAMFASCIKDRPLEYIVFEVYEDEKSYQVHRKSPQYKAYVDSVGAKLTKRHVYEIEPLFLKEKLPSNIWIKPTNHFLKFAHIQVSDKEQEVFEKSVIINMQTSMEEEAGVFAMYALRDIKNPTTYYFYEVYASDKAYESHRLTKHFQRYILETKDLVIEKIC